MTEETVAAAEKKSRRKGAEGAEGEAPARVVGPRPAYITYTQNEDGSINVVEAYRKAEEVLAAVDADKSLKYFRIMIK